MPRARIALSSTFYSTFIFFIFRNIYIYPGSIDFPALTITGRNALVSGISFYLSFITVFELQIRNIE